MARSPSFQYYPDDWRADAVSGCSLAARGLWHEMMNMMHGAERYGYLSVNGRPIPDETIARYCGCSVEEYRTLLAELDCAGAPRRTREGIIYCSRMVNDQRQREEWRKQKKNQRLAADTCPQDVREMSETSTELCNIDIVSTPLILRSSDSKPPNRKKFQPPSREQVSLYMQEIGVPVSEVEKFFDHHEQRNWKLSGGRGPKMTDWKASVRTWKSNIGSFGGIRGQAPDRLTRNKQALAGSV